MNPTPSGIQVRAESDSAGSVLEIVRRTLAWSGAPPFPVEAALKDLGASSLHFMKILAEVEQRFSVTIPDEYLEPANLPTARAIFELVDRLR